WEEGVPFISVAAGHYLSPRVQFALSRALRRIRPDVVVCYTQGTVRAGVLAVPLASIGASVRRTLPGRPRPGSTPPIVLYYGLENDFKKKPYNRWVVAPQIARVVANAEATRRELEALGCFAPGRLHVIYDALDGGPIELA